MIAHAEQHIVSYPIPSMPYINLIVFVTIPGGFGTPCPDKSWVKEATREELKEMCVGMEEEVQALIDVSFLTTIVNRRAWKGDVMDVTNRLDCVAVATLLVQL